MNDHTDRTNQFRITNNVACICGHVYQYRDWEDDGEKKCPSCGRLNEHSPDEYTSDFQNQATTMTENSQYERDKAIPGSIPSSVKEAGERAGVTNRTEDADEYSLLGITSLSYGPSYMIEITDGPDADEQIEYADTIRIGGVHVGVSEAEIECKEWRIVDREGSRRRLVIDSIEQK